MLFLYKRLANGARMIQAELRRDGQVYRSGWQKMPDTGMGIDERRVASAEVIDLARKAARSQVASVYRGED